MNSSKVREILCRYTGAGKKCTVNTETAQLNLETVGTMHFTAVNPRDYRNQEPQIYLFGSVKSILCEGVRIYPCFEGEDDADDFDNFFN